MKNMLSIPRKDLIEYLAIISILLTSKSTYFMMNNIACILSFIFIAAFIAIKNNKFFINVNSSIKFLFFLYILYIVNSVYYNSYRVTFFIYPLGTYLILSCIELENFRKKLLNVTYVIAILSVLVYIAHLFHLITPTFTRTMNSENEIWHWFGFNFVNTYSWYVQHRHAGPFHEPGAFQIILNLALLFNLGNLFKEGRKETFKEIVILLALFLTMSTTAYLSAILILTVSFRDKILTSRYLAIPLLLMFIVICYYILTSDVVINKFAGHTDEGTSAYIRKNDMLACLRMFQEHPFLGIGNGSDFAKYSLLYDNRTSSNGIIAELARLGIFWLILYFSYYCKAVKKFCANNKLNYWAIIIIGIILFSNEDMMGFPIAYIMIFQFKNSLSKNNYPSSLDYKQET